MSKHICDNISSFPISKFHQLGKGMGRKVLIIGESPAPNGWRVSGIACYDPKGKILPTGRRLNELLSPFGVSVETCGFTELSKCYVSKRKELKACSEKCWPIFLRQIKGKRYRLFILLGVHTTKTFSSLIHKDLSIGELNTAIVGNRRYQVLPLYHPSPINPYGHDKNKKIFRELNTKIRSVVLYTPFCRAII